MREWIYGRNSVYEALRAGRRQFFRLLIAEGVQEKGRLVDVQGICAKKKVPIERVKRARLDALAENHQGLALESSAYPYSNLVDILEHAQQYQEPPFILILDTIQDPQNLGTLLRTAEIVGVHGVLLPFRHAATITPSVVNASSGASEHLLVAQVNLAQAIESLKEAGVWVFGLEDNPEAKDIVEIHLDGALALVVGNEAEGMRPLVRSSCDGLLKLPMRGKIESYNAAVAGSIGLFMSWRARNFSGSRD